MDFLTQQHRPQVSRHQSARSAFDYSWKLLSIDEQHKLATLTVFKGGFEADAAWQICEIGIANIAALVDKSLIAVSDEGRYGFHALIYQFAREHLETHTMTLFESHASYYLQLALDAQAQLQGQDQATWLKRLEAEHGNLIAALSWAYAQTKTGLACRLATSLGTFWEVRGYYQLGRDWYNKLLAGTWERDSTLRAEVLYAAGGLSWQQSDYASAQQYYEESLSIRQSKKEHHGVAACLHSLGIIAKNQGNYQKARQLYQESLELRRSIHDQRGMANTLNNLGNIAKDQGDYAAAEDLYLESLSLSRKLSNQRGTANTLNNLGIIASDQGRTKKAQQLYQESLEIRKSLGDQRGIAVSLNNLGNSARDQQDFSKALALFEESLTITQSIGNKQGAANTIKTMASIAVEQGDYTKAKALFQESLSINQGIANKLELAGNFEDIAILQLKRAQAETGIQLWAAAEQLRISIAAPNTTKRVQQLEQAKAEISPQNLEKIWHENWIQGQNLSLKQAIQLAFFVLST